MESLRRQESFVKPEHSFCGRTKFQSPVPGWVSAAKVAPFRERLNIARGGVDYGECFTPGGRRAVHFFFVAHGKDGESVNREEKILDFSEFSIESLRRCAAEFGQSLFIAFTQVGKFQG